MGSICTRCNVLQPHTFYSCSASCLSQWSIELLMHQLIICCSPTAVVIVVIATVIIAATAVVVVFLAQVIPQLCSFDELLIYYLQFPSPTPYQPHRLPQCRVGSPTLVSHRLPHIVVLARTAVADDRHPLMGTPQLRARHRPTVHSFSPHRLRRFHTLPPPFFAPHPNGVVGCGLRTHATNVGTIAKNDIVPLTGL